MGDTKLARKCIKALERLKIKSTWQEIADYLTASLNDGRTVWRSEVWRWANTAHRSAKVLEAMVAAGEIPGPKKRYRLHAEFQTKKEMQDFMDYYGIDNTRYTFTNWTKDTFENSLYVEDIQDFFTPEQLHE